MAEPRPFAATLEDARHAIALAKAEIPAADRAAQERRQALHEASRSRAELEEQLIRLAESEHLVRSRREQAESRARGLRGAASFATFACNEAEAAGDHARAERERAVAERAARERGTAEALATEEWDEERRIAELRADVDARLAQERERESTIARERRDAERRARDLREALDKATHALHLSESARERTRRKEPAAEPRPPEQVPVAPVAPAPAASVAAAPIAPVAALPPPPAPSLASPAAAVAVEPEEARELSYEELERLAFNPETLYDRRRRPAAQRAPSALREAALAALAVLFGPFSLRRRRARRAGKRAGRPAIKVR
jgi:hypothetical protein